MTSLPPYNHFHQHHSGLRRGTVFSLQETGTARLVFAVDFRSFHGVLINSQGETFALQSVTPIRQSSSTSDDDDDMQQHASTSSTTIDISIVDGETGNEYVVHNIRQTITTTNNHLNNGHHHSTNIVQLESGTLRFQADEVLVGNRADIEINKYINPTQLIGGQSVHVGTMTINVQTSITPPPTPRRESSDDVPMEESDDFLA
jgi:hypothetical protein